MRRWGKGADFGGVAIYLMSDASAYHTGDTFVIDASEGSHEYRLVRTKSLDDFSMATPAIVGDRLLIRTQHRLYSIRKGAR